MIARFYKIFRWLSLDITAGAIFVSMLFCKVFEVAFAWQEMTLLGLSVWVIYMVDHLLDVRTESEWINERRGFHKRNERILKLLVVLGITSASGLLFFISHELLFYGMGLSIACAAYFILSRRILGMKEFSGALLYTVGVCLIPLISTSIQTIWLPMTLLFLLASFNLVLFSLLDRNTDKKEAMRSFAVTFGSRITRNVVIVIAALLSLGIGYYLLTGGSVFLAIFFFIGWLSHLIIFINRWFHDFDRFKIVGDLTFVMAGLLLLF